MAAFPSRSKTRMHPPTKKRGVLIMADHGEQTSSDSSHSGTFTRYGMSSPKNVIWSWPNVNSHKNEQSESAEWANDWSKSERVCKESNWFCPKDKKFKLTDYHGHLLPTTEKGTLFSKFIPIFPNKLFGSFLMINCFNRLEGSGQTDQMWEKFRRFWNQWENDGSKGRSCQPFQDI